MTRTSADAINDSQSYAVATQADTGDALQANADQSIADLQNRLPNLQSRVDSNYKRADGGIAAAIATVVLRHDDRPGEISTGAAPSGWNGELGLAGGIGATSSDGQWRVDAAFALSPPRAATRMWPRWAA